MQKKYSDTNELQELTENWMDYMRTATIDVEVPKPDRFGGCIVQKKPMPCTVDSYLQWVGISSTLFGKWMHGGIGQEEYQRIAQEVHDFCNDQTLKNTMLGFCTDKIGIFYLVNNSRYKDVSEVITENTTKVLPAWMSGGKIEISDKEGPKALPHESIPFTDIPHTRTHESMPMTQAPINQDEYDFL